MYALMLIMKAYSVEPLLATMHKLSMFQNFQHDHAHFSNIFLAKKK